MSTPWFSGIAAATARVECGGESHVLRWREGQFRALAHPLADLEAERALAALAGQSCRCVELLDAWERHAADPRVLVIGPRAQDSRLALEHREMAQMRRRGSAIGVAVIGGTSPAGVSADSDEQIRGVLDLGGGLPHLFVATVAAALADHLDDPELGPTLQAALYGRVLASIQRWTDRMPELELVMGDRERSLVRHPDGQLAATLPFSWITEVWAHRLDVVDGELTLAARRTESGTIEIITVDHAMSTHTRTLARP